LWRVIVDFISVALQHNVEGERFFDKWVDITEASLAWTLHIPLRDDGTDGMSYLFSADTAHGEVFEV
jgi:hypothetical protein